MHCLLLFLDGVGLGPTDPTSNPFSRQAMPALSTILGNQSLLADRFDFQAQNSDRASWLALDACLGVPGLPQSATGQAALLTGLNIPMLVGGHDGPKPGPAIAAYLNNGNLLSTLRQAGQSVSLLNAYPLPYFEAIHSGYRIPGTIAMTAICAGLSLKTTLDLQKGQALSADFTGQGWHNALHIPNIPLITPFAAGVRMAQLASTYSFSIFEFWLSDITGHRQEMQSACHLLSTLDEVIAGLTHSWSDDDGLILITSDHGNLEDLNTRRHTTNLVPLILIGAPNHRQRFLDGMQKENPGSVSDLTRITPAIVNFIG
jgi:2,3-bisphosphoglycerate-independent phosphoglycerate mutase